MRRTLEFLLVWGAAFAFGIAVWALAIGIVWQAVR